MAFNYEGMLDSLNEKAFHYCKELLWPICGFKVLTKDEIRQVDLKERVLQLCEEYSKETRISSRREVEYYYETLEWYFSGFLDCKEDSRATSYKERALSILRNHKQKSSGSVEDAETALMVFLSLFRSLATDNLLDQARKWRLVDTSFTVRIEDGELLEYIRTSDYLTPYDMKYTHPIIFESLGDKLPEKVIQARKNRFHLANSIILSMALQSSNAFEETGTQE